MGFRLIGNLVANAGRKNKCSAVFKLRLQFTSQAQQDMALFAPVVSQIIWRVLHHSHADSAKLLRTPESRSGFPVMCRWFDRRPVGESEGYISYSHSWESVAFFIESTTSGPVEE